MKKLLIGILCTGIILNFTGCGEIRQGDSVFGNKFYVKECIEGDITSSNVYVIVDKKSGVNYYYIVCGASRAMSPVYNSNGSLVIDEVNK